MLLHSSLERKSVSVPRMQAQQKFTKTASAFNSGKRQWHALKMSGASPEHSFDSTCDLKVGVHNFMEMKRFWFCFGTSEWLDFCACILFLLKHDNGS